MRRLIKYSPRTSAYGKNQTSSGVSVGKNNPITNSVVAFLFASIFFLRSYFLIIAEITFLFAVTFFAAMAVVDHRS